MSPDIRQTTSLYSGWASRYSAMTSARYSVRVSLPETSTDSSMRLAPITRSAPFSLAAALWVRSPGPIPIPMRVSLLLPSGFSDS